MSQRIGENPGRESLLDGSCDCVVVDLARGDFGVGVRHLAFFEDASEYCLYLWVQIFRTLSRCLALLIFFAIHPFHGGTSSPTIERYNPACCWFFGRAEYLYAIQGGYIQF